MGGGAAIPAISEIVGAAGVIVSLVYLAIQVRQKTRVARAATRQAIAESHGGGRQHLSSRQLAIAVLRWRGWLLCQHRHAMLRVATSTSRGNIFGKGRS